VGWFAWGRRITLPPVKVPAIVAAGDRKASKAVYGQSKVYLEIQGRPLVAHVVAALQRVPEISEVWVVGNGERLREVFDREDIRSELRKPLHIQDQFRNLYENVWETYRRTLPGAGADGRDPGPEDMEQPILYISGDVPLVTPQELSDFVQHGLELDCSYVLGLVTEEAMEGFYPSAPGETGVEMAYYNLREGRFRQSNVHLVKPAKIVNRHYIEEMYELRYQKQFWNIAALTWTIASSEQGGLRMALYFSMIQLAGVLHRAGWHRLADRVRRFTSVQRVEEACSSLLRADFRIVTTEIGGAALDVDNEHDFDATVECFDTWRKIQTARAEQLYGPLPLPAVTESGTPAAESAVTESGTPVAEPAVTKSGTPADELEGDA
jgi:GTP:adenosylcobinamide-phosphate guanylyltransferase